MKNGAWRHEDNILAFQKKKGIQRKNGQITKLMNSNGIMDLFIKDLSVLGYKPFIRILIMICCVLSLDLPE